MLLRKESLPKCRNQGASTVIGRSKQGVEDSPGYIAEERQTRHLQQRWGWVEETIWTENMLKALVNGVKGGKWFSLIDKVHRTQTLESAWTTVRRNKGAAGVDGLSIKQVDRNPSKHLEELQRQLQTGTYRPKPVKRVLIPKGEGKARPLGIPTVIDRVAQMAVKLAIEPIFENEFLSMSYGFRPGRGAKDALRKVDQCLKEGLVWVVDADLQAFFDTIPHDRLMARVERHISDGNILKLLKLWLKQEVMSSMKTWVPKEGSPQGAVISPLLANLYLHDLDQLIASHGAQMVRYADDFVILCASESEAQAALSVVKQWVEENKLTLHPEKTHLGNCQIEGQGFEFLGYRFEGGTRWVRQKSILKFREGIRARTRRTCGSCMEAVIARLNPMLKGWYNYFKHVDKWGLERFDSFVRRRLRAILRKNEKRPSFGASLDDHRKWPNAFFANLGLFSMEQSRKQELAQQSLNGTYQLESRMR